MIEPSQKDDALLADIAAAREEPDALHIWWLGQSGFLAEFNGTTVLFDPYLSHSLTHKYAETEKQHVRMTELVVDPAKLTQIDVVTSSHNHTDHLDAETLLALMGANPDVAFVIPEANRAFIADRLQRDADRPTGLSDGESTTIKGVDFFGITAAHEDLSRDENGKCHFMGFVARIGPWTLYHSGDSILHDGLVEQLNGFNIDVAFLPINGSIPERNVAGNFDGAEAAQLARDIGTTLAIPCHYDLFEFNTATTDLFEESCTSMQQEFEVMENGERITLE
ncbi:MAG TPA: MBL fold metallo-hydrolase [Candidatus Hydrogenedentes bacterium]|nr:MBL fold metallo-hydrolase [Candidatus Hydrogenedentota bacterium]